MPRKAKETGEAKQSKGEGGKVREENKKNLPLLIQHAENKAEGHVNDGRKEKSKRSKT